MAQVAHTRASKIRSVMRRPEIAKRPAIYMANLTISLRLKSVEMAEYTVIAECICGKMMSFCSRRTVAGPAITFFKVFIICVIDPDVLRHIIH
jgi:hypothetical protein